MSIAMGGDETGGIVGDIGSRCSKFGFGGTDTPTCVMGSALGCVFPEGTAYRRTDAEDEPELRELTAEDFALPPDYPARLHARSPWARAPRPAPPLPTAWLDGDVAAACAARHSRKESCVVREPCTDGDLDDWDVVEQLWHRAFASLKGSGKEHPVLAGYPSWASRQCRET